MTLGEKIQLSRKKKGMSQEDLANLLNVSRQAVQKWEANNSTPELEKLVQISNIFEVSLDYLLKDQEKEQMNNEVHENNQNVESKKPQTQSTYKEDGMIEGRIRVCKVWLIIGAVLSPLAAGGAYLNNQYKPEAFFFLFLYLITIPFCCLTISAIRKAKTKKEVIGWGIASIFLVSAIGGIMILTSKFKIKEKTIETSDSNNTNAQKNSSLEESKYSLLKQFIYNYETKHSFADLREIVTISKFLSNSNYKDTKEIFGKYEPIYSQKAKEQEASKKKTLKTVGVIGLIVVFLVAIIVPVSIGVAANNKKKQYEETYNQIISLLDNYDDSNYSHINELITDLYGSDYETKPLYEDLYGKHNYELLLNALKNFYKNRNFALSNIKDLIDKSKVGYKQYYNIKSDYEQVAHYISVTSSDASSRADDNTNDGTAENNRIAIANMYSLGNTTGLWNFDTYVKYFSMPYLVCGVRFSSNDHYIKWYKDSSGGHLSWDIPLPSTYNSSTTYYYSSYFEGCGYKNATSNERYGNTFRFSLKTSNGSSFYFFRIDSIRFDVSSQKFKIDVYYYGNGQTETLTQE